MHRKMKSKTDVSWLIILALFLVLFPDMMQAVGTCFSKYIERTGKCRKKIREAGRIIRMDFESCCRMKGAHAWQLRMPGLKRCFKCPDIVDGNWSNWSEWSSCPVTCDWGNTTRTRACDNPVPKHGGKECVGKSHEKAVCYAGKRCPINGGWGEWGEWQACSKTCKGGGLQFQNRKCDSPRPQFGGKICIGPFERSRKCNEDVECPVHGSWGSWGSWSACSQEYISTRKRQCDNPSPQHGGKKCDGQGLQVSSCPGKEKCTKVTGSGSGAGSGSGSGSGSSDDCDIDIKVETNSGVVQVTPTNSTKLTKVTEAGSGSEGSGEDGSGSDDSESGDVILEEIAGGDKNEAGAKGSGQNVDGSGSVDVIVERDPKISNKLKLKQSGGKQGKPKTGSIQNQTQIP